MDTFMIILAIICVVVTLIMLVPKPNEYVYVPMYSLIGAYPRQAWQVNSGRLFVRETPQDIIVERHVSPDIHKIKSSDALFYEVQYFNDLDAAIKWSKRRRAGIPA